MISPDRNQKPSSVDGVVDDVRQILNILGKENLNKIYDEGLNLLCNKYINSAVGTNSLCIKFALLYYI